MAAGSLQVLFVTLSILLAVYYSGKSPLIIRKISQIAHGKPGCLPAPTIANATLHYFAVRGRGEVIRLMLEEAQIPYTEVTFNKETWPKHKQRGIESGLLTFGQVPALETDSGVKLVQTLAILHYVGRAVGMDCDCEDLHVCEIIAFGTEDVRSKLSRMIYDPNYTLGDRLEYLMKTIPMWLGHFEKFAPSLSKQDKAFFTSDRLTWVDFLMFDLLDINVEFSQFNFGSGVSKVDVLSKFPKLNNFYIQFKRRPNIAKYLSSDKRRGYSLPNLPKDMAAEKSA